MSNSVITWPKVLLYGDSITQYSFTSGGWGAAIADKLQRKCDVLNRGFSGYNSRWNLAMLPRIIDSTVAKDIVAMTIFLGANDSTLKELNPKQHVPLDEYKKNLPKMVDYLESVGLSREKIVVIGPPPCDDKTWRKQCDMEGKTMSKDNKVTGLYAAASEQAARESRVEFIELYNSMMADRDWSRFLCDGLHFSAEGSKYLFDRLWPAIEARTAHLSGLILPYWQDVDENEPASSLLS